MENSPKGGAKLWQSSAWSFGSLVKSLSTKSEEVLQAYQRDLQEFGVGLKKESAVAAEVTAHAVKDLPISLENTAAVAQESLEAVGQTLEEFGSSFWRGTAELIGQVKEAVKKVDEDNSDSSEASSASTPITTGRYSRYEAQLNAMQCDSGTYCDEPEDEEDYAAWKLTFDLHARKDEVKDLLEDNSFIEELYTRIVPTSADHDTFWTRYFYRLNKLQQAEDARADLVKRATAVEEDLTWEVDEDNDNDMKNACLPDQVTEKVPTSVEEGIAEDEARSDNSAGSEWLVVQEERDPLETTRPSQASAEGQQINIKKDQDSEESRTGVEGRATEEKDEVNLFPFRIGVNGSEVESCLPYLNMELLDEQVLIVYCCLYIYVCKYCWNKTIQWPSCCVQL